MHIMDDIEAVRSPRVRSKLNAPWLPAAALQNRALPETHSVLSECVDPRRTAGESEVNASDEIVTYSAATCLRLVIVREELVFASIRDQCIS